MRPRWACGYLCPRQSLPATLRDLRWLACVFAHPQHAVDLSTLLDQEFFRMHVAVNDARRLKLDALFRVYGAAHFAADDGLAAHHIAFHFPAPMIDSPGTPSRAPPGAGFFSENTAISVPPSLVPADRRSCCRVESRSADAELWTALSFPTNR